MVKGFYSIMGVYVSLSLCALAGDYKASTKESFNQLPIRVYMSPGPDDSTYFSLVYRSISPFLNDTYMSINVIHNDGSAIFLGSVASRKHYVGVGMKRWQFKIDNEYIENSTLIFTTDWTSPEDKELSAETYIRIRVSLSDLYEWYKSHSNAIPPAELSDDERLVELSNLKGMTYDEWNLFRENSLLIYAETNAPPESEEEGSARTLKHFLP